MGLHYDRAASTRCYQRMDRICKIDQERLSIRQRQQRLEREDRELTYERASLVRENQDDEWLAEGKRWEGEGEVIDLREYRGRMRFKVRTEFIGLPGSGARAA